MIRFEHVTRCFGTIKAVDAFTLEVAEGETLMLLGTSGCGKTTTLRMANRLIEPTSGAIYMNGRDIRDQKPEALRQGIGYILQHNSLFPHYTVGENIAVVPRLLGWKASEINARIAELMKQLHLPAEYQHVYPAALSGGQQQRVNIARALAADPPVLLMDEPFGALDPVTRLGIRKEFRSLEALQRKTIMMVTHDVEEAFALGDRICLMHGGKILQAGTPSELLFHPAHPYVKEFLSAQYLSLSLKAVTLSHLLPYLRDEQGDGNDPEKKLGEQESVWDALERDATDGKGSGSIAIRTANQIIATTAAAIITAFNRYQQRAN